MPLQAQPSEAEMNIRAEAIGYLAAMKCFVINGMLDQAAADGLVVEYVTEDPKSKPGVVWAQTTTAGNAAVQAILPHVNSDCQGLSIDNEKAGELVYPYIIQ